MSPLAKAFTVPSVILPALATLMCLAAFLLRRRSPESPWLYRDILAAGCTVSVLFCALLAARGLPRPREAVKPAAIEVDMRVSGGSIVELWVNDWQHPSERLPVIAGERHVYQFKKVPRKITLLRLDPTEQPGAQIVVYSLTVKAGGRILRQFGPAELKDWTLVNLSPPKQENGGLVLLDTNDDPNLWTPLKTPLRIPGPSLAAMSRKLLLYSPYLVTLAGLLLLLWARLFDTGQVAALLRHPAPSLGIPALSWCVVLAAILTAGLTVYLEDQRGDGDPGVEVDMLVSRGHNVQLFLNDWSDHPPQELPVVVGQRHIYRFENLPQEITRLRLDPTDRPDAGMVIYSIAVKTPHRTFRQFVPSGLKNWTFANLSPPRDENQGLAFDDTSDDPYLWTSLDLQLPARPWQAMAAGLIDTSDSPFLLVIAAFLLVLLMRMSTRAGRMEAVLIAAVTFVAWPVVLLVKPLHLALPPVSTTVGYASYNGYAKGGEYLSAFTVALLCAGLGLLFARLAGPDNKELEKIGPPSRLRNIWIAAAAVFGMLWLVDLPDLNGVFRSLGQTVYGSHGWDDANLLTWSYLIHAGLLPYRDFWYPYTGAYLQSLPFPAGVISGAVHATMVLGGLFVALLMATGRKLAHALAIFGLILALVLLDMLPGWTRYLLAVDVALLYVGVYDSRRFDWKLHIPFAAFVSYAFFYEPTQVIYAGFGIAAHTVLSVLSRLRVAEGELPLSPATSALSRFRIAKGALRSGLLSLLPATSALSRFRIAKGELQSGSLSLLPATSALSRVRIAKGELQSGSLPLLPATSELSRVRVAKGELQSGSLPLLPATSELSRVRVAKGELQSGSLPLLPATSELSRVRVAKGELQSGSLPLSPATSALSRFRIAKGALRSGLLSLLPATSALSRARVAEGARVLRQRLVYVGLPMLAGIAGSLLIFAWNGMLTGWWDFEKSIGDQGNYGALPSGIAAWVLPILQPDTVFLLMFLLMSYAVYRWARSKGRPDPLGAALLVLCGTSFMAMQKQILRPHIMTQARIFPYAAVLIFGLIVWRERRPAARIVIAGFMGCILGIAIHHKLFREIVRQDVEGGPRKVSASIHTLLANPKEFALVNANLYSRSRFAGFDVQNAVVDNLIQAGGLRAEDSVYVLGDESTFYILLNHRPPYVFNTYNDSPIYEQQKVVDWFHRTHPRFVIWAPEDSTYDLVPHRVRLPLIYNYVVGHYEFLRAVGPYQILAERPPTQPPDLKYWSRELGSQVDLGHIPERARLSEYAPCGQDITRCDAVLVVRYSKPKPVPSGLLTVDIDSSGNSFQLQFEVEPGNREYVINLNRLWFWNLLSSSTKPAIAPRDAKAEVAIEYRWERSPVLY